MKKLIIITIVLLMIIVLFNRIEIKAQEPIKTNMDTTINNMIGCMDYEYAYKLNIPATMTFYVLDKNKEDKEGFFKVIDGRGNITGSTVLHCGNSYFLVVSTEGYKDYTEKIEEKYFRPAMEIHEINLEKK